MGFWAAVAGLAVDGRSRVGTVNSLTFLAADSIPWANSKAVLNDNSFSESKRRWIMVSLIPHTMQSRSIVLNVRISEIAGFSYGSEL